MANNPQFTGGPSPPFHPPMVGTIPAPQNIPPPMTQFRPVAPAHPSQQFAPPLPQQYQPLGTGIPATNSGMPLPQTQQMQFAQPMQQAPARPSPPGHLPPMSQSMALPNIQLNRPMTSGMPQPVLNQQNPSSFVPASGGPGVPVAPVYAPSTYPTSQYQVVSQMNIQSNPVSELSLPASGHQGAALVTPVHLNGQPSQPSTSISTASMEFQAVDSQGKRLEQSSSDWLEHTKNGRRYYYNKKTRQSTWEKPLELMTPLERADATTDWKEYTSPDGRKYYYNKVTKQSKWIIPEELKRAREQAEKASGMTDVAGSCNASAAASLSEIKTPSNAEAKSSTPVVHSSPVAVTPVAGATTPSQPSPGSSSLHHDSVIQTDAVNVQSPAETASTVAAGAAVSGNVESHAASGEAAALPASDSNTAQANQSADSARSAMAQGAEEANKSTGISGKTNVTASGEKAIEHETPTYASKQEAKDAFKALLESVNVETDWTWEQTMRLIINDKRYAALKSLGERKQAFSEYLNQKKRQEAEERRARTKKAREDFRKMLEECSELTSTTRWGKAVKIFGDDERFKAIERARDREDMFEEYLAELEKKESEKAEEDRRRNIIEYRKFLESCDFIKANSQWRKVKDRLESDERCSRLETMDRLKIFQEYVGDLEKEEEDQRRIQKEELRKSERKNRDEFRKLLDGHVADGTLSAKTNWRDYHSKVKDLPAYLASSSNTSGSTPKELFDDVVEELKKQYQEDRTRIKDAVKTGKVALSSSWTLEEFKAAIANEISSSGVSENNLKLVFDELLERAREKEEKEAKRRKRLGDEFFNMLCSLKDITGDSKWEDCLPLFEAREEFRSMGDEAFAKQVFEEYLAQLREKEKERDRKRKDEKAKKEKERERDKRSKDRREKDRRHERSRGKDRSEKDEGDGEPDFSEISVSNENRKSGKDKDRKHRKRHHDEEDDASSDKNGKDYSRSSHRHSSERKKSKQMEQHADLSESDDESRHKKHKREHRNGSRKRVDNDELEDGELGI